MPPDDNITVDSPGDAAGNRLAPEGCMLPQSDVMLQSHEPLPDEPQPQEPRESDMSPPLRAPGAAAVLREFPQFLKKPAVLQPSGLRAPGALTALTAIVGLYLAVQLLLMLPFLKYWQTAFGLPAPDAFGKIDPLYLPFLVVLVAPVLEEVLFRGWQTGTPRALWLIGCGATGAAALYFSTYGLPPLAAGAVLAGALLAAVTGGFALRRRRTPMGWFVRAFPAIFYLVVAVFALSHLTNYATFSLLAVPMVLPQAWGALLLGFARQRIGLPGSILAHAGVNGVILGVAQLGY